MDRALEEQIWERARSRCEYCLLPARYTEAPFQIDHIIARKHGGETIATNLALSCYSCNSYKGPNIASLDPDSGRLVRLFHPRKASEPAAKLGATATIGDGSIEWNLVDVGVDAASA